jgi:hypothetical protein
MGKTGKGDTSQGIGAYNHPRQQFPQYRRDTRQLNQPAPQTYCENYNAQLEYQLGHELSNIHKYMLRLYESI